MVEGFRECHMLWESADGMARAYLDSIASLALTRYLAASFVQLLLDIWAVLSLGTDTEADVQGNSRNDMVLPEFTHVSQPT